MLTRRSSKRERQENLAEWMNDFDMLVEKATPSDVKDAVGGDHYIVYFENKVPTFDMNERNYSFPKCPDPPSLDKTDHTIELESILTDPVLELAYDYFLRGYSLRFVKAQCVPGLVNRLQKLFDDGSVDYDKTMFFDLRYEGRTWQWESVNYLSGMKKIVNPSRKQQFPSLRDLIERSWGHKFPETIRPTGVSTIQKLMTTDYIHSLSRMRPNYNREIIHGLTYAGENTDVKLSGQSTWKLNLTMDFVPSRRRKRERDGITYNVSLEFHAGTRALERPPYEANMEDTDVEDNGG